MTVPESLMKTKLKIKIGSKGIRVESEKESRECGPHVLVHDKCTNEISVTKNKKLNSDINVKLPVQCHSKKRSPDAVQDAGKEKRQRMDRSIKQQCRSLLKELMSHVHGWAFNQPVDPVAYNIPDYFTVITRPIDLGTIKSKLENNVYLCADEFANDVVLTFSNCMSYNPPYNTFHCMAKELNDIFQRRWKLLEAKLKRESTSVEQECILNGNAENAQGILQTSRTMSPCHVSSVSRRKMSLEEKQKLSKELKEMLRGKMTEKLLNVLKKYDLCSLKERIDVDISSIDEEILWDLKRMVKSSSNLTSEKVEPVKVSQSGRRPLSREVIDTGTDSDSRISCGSANAKAPVSTVDSTCGSCGSLTCRCSLQNSKAQATSKRLSERALQHGNCGVSGNDCEVENLTIVHVSKSDPDANGAGSVVEENVCRSPGSSSCGSTTVSNGDWTPLIDVQLSPKKALRAAMLKKRFADTIFKAKQKTLLDQGDKSQPVKSQQEKVRLEKQQHEEKARIEAQIIAAEAASRLRAEADLKMQRAREREAARIALQQMERTVEIDDNLKFLKDLERLSQTSEPDYLLGECFEVKIGAAEGGHVKNPLERLGLYIKEDIMEDYDEEAILGGDGEEGGISS